MSHSLEFANVVDQNKKIHPHKFTLWVGIASILMMFAGLTSAYLVKREQPGWTNFQVPLIFWYSTATILISSLTMYIALKSFRERSIIKYKRLVAVTALLGILFMVLQFFGFRQLWLSGMVLRGSGAAQFLYIIAGLHALHVLGGVIAVLTLFVRSGNARIRSYNIIPVEVVSTYWHFVDLLWIYLFIFFLWVQ
ncbi:MAG: cytochrome c oxidase subunit 3 [Bacteroidota bacterium]|nr:cytochrome c oxidase subunit 3 [Bacteroidota bacterium]